MAKNNKDRNSKRRLSFESILIVSTLLIVSIVILAVVLFFILIRPFKITGQAMSPNFKDNQYVLTTRISNGNNSIKRGDVVVFRYPVSADILFIKRIIGLPGDEIQIKSGEVYINGSKLDESEYLSLETKTYPGKFLSDGDEIIIPEGYYFVMGDNRSKSSDSREWGLVAAEKVISKVKFCCLNCN